MARVFGASLGYVSGNGGAEVTTIVRTLPSAVPAGAEVFVVVGHGIVDGAVAVADSAGNTYERVGFTDNTSYQEYLDVFRGVATSGIPSGGTVTATFTPGTYYRRMAVFYFTGGPASALAEVKDGEASGFDSISLVNTPDMTSTDASDLILMVMLTVNQVTMAFDAPATEIIDTSDAQGAIMAAYEQPGAAGTFDVSGNLSGGSGWTAYVVGLKGATGPVGPPPQQARPDADVATAGWAAAPLWSKVDEAVADDGDFITSTAS
jgi:hypothetical protein